MKKLVCVCVYIKKKKPPYYTRAVGAYTPHAVLVREQR